MEIVKFFVYLTVVVSATGAIVVRITVPESKFTLEKFDFNRSKCLISEYFIFHCCVLLLSRFFDDRSSSSSLPCIFSFSPSPPVAHILIDNSISCLIVVCLFLPVPGRCLLLTCCLTRETLDDGEKESLEKQKLCKLINLFVQLFNKLKNL